MQKTQPTRKDIMFKQKADWIAFGIVLCVALRICAFTEDLTRLLEDYGFTSHSAFWIGLSAVTLMATLVSCGLHSLWERLLQKLQELADDRAFRRQQGLMPHGPARPALRVYICRCAVTTLIITPMTHAHRWKCASCGTLHATPPNQQERFKPNP